MNDEAVAHPEFFKAPADKDLVDHEEKATPTDSASEAPERAVAPADNTGGSTVDALLEVSASPLPVLPYLPAATDNRRKAAGLIALLGGVIFALLYAGLVFVLIGLRQDPASVLPSTLSFLSTPIYWLTTVAFTGFFALLTVIVGRGSWLFYVIGSFFVAILTYAAALGAGLIAIHAWEVTFAEAQGALWDGIAFSPLLLITPILGREISLWLGLWISRRGKRLPVQAGGTVALSQ